MKIYLFDFKNPNSEKIENYSNSIGRATRLSERSFEVEMDRRWEFSDVAKLWPFIGNRGHIFIYEMSQELDPETSYNEEYYREKSPRGRIKSKATDLDLDTISYTRIEQSLEARQDQT